MRVVNPAGSNTRRTRCVSNIGEISFALSIYQGQYTGYFPDKSGDLGFKLIKSNVSDLKVFKCPKDKAKNLNGNSAFKSDYIYLGGFKKETTPPVPIVFDKINNHKDYCNVLFSNRELKRYEFQYSSYEKLIDHIIEQKHYKKGMKDILKTKVKEALVNNSKK